MLIHFLAFCFFIYAFQTLSFLYDTTLVETVRHSSEQEAIKTINKEGKTASDLVYFSTWVNTSGFIGLLVGFAISLIISFKRQWFWVNSILTFILTYLLFRFDLLAWTFIKKIFLLSGQLFNKSTMEFLLAGTILLTIGFLIFFLRQPNQFIENKNSTT